MNGVGKMNISPLLAAAVVGAILIIFVVAVILHSRLTTTQAITGVSNSQATAPPIPTPPGVLAEDQQFLAGVQSAPPGQGRIYAAKNPGAMQDFMLFATPAQRMAFDKAMVGK